MKNTAQESEKMEMKRALQVKEYAAEIQLFTPFEALPQKRTLEEREALVDQLFLKLYEGIEAFDLATLGDYSEKRELLHGIINTLKPYTLGVRESKALDELLQAELQDKTLTDTDELLALKGFVMGSTPVKMWQGDISTLKVDAIVNAANNQLMGCWEPLHDCTDNRIHTAAGVQLRDDCHLIMEKQGFEEPTGRAKITRAYNLPSKYVLHTVGPVVQGEVSGLNKEDLANSYIHCLETCRAIDAIRSIAFSNISTGEFGFPTKEAAQVALRTVSLWLERYPKALDLVIFNVYTDEERTVYQGLFDKMQ